METIVVTGGAGFIGSNFVRHALARTEARGRRARQAHLRGQPREPGRRGVPPALRLRAGATSPTARRSGRCLREHRPDAVVNFAAETHVDRSIDDPGAFVRTNVTGAFELLEAARLHLRESPRDGFRFLHVSTDEVYGTLGADRGLLGDDALRAELALRRVEGGRRPPRARVPRDLRPARPDHQLLEQLRPLPVPREAHPAHDPERGRGQEPADLRRRRERARLALRRGPLRGHPARAAQGRPRREVQRRRRQRADEPAGRGRPVRGARGGAARPRRTPPSRRAGSPPTPASRRS